MQISRPAPTRPASSDYFTGTVWHELVVSAPEPSRLRALVVHFAPGGRTHWHTHPLGQALHVLSGVGRAQIRGGPVQIIRAGDSVWFPPGEEHWHGADPDHAMTHLAMQEALDGSAVTWLEPVSEGEYTAAPD